MCCHPVALQASVSHACISREPHAYFTQFTSTKHSYKAQNWVALNAAFDTVCALPRKFNAEDYSTLLMHGVEDGCQTTCDMVSRLPTMGIIETAG
jgi:hypothetical protein